MPQHPQAWEEEPARFSSTLADRNKQTKQETIPCIRSFRIYPRSVHHSVVPPSPSDLGKGQPLLTEKLKVRLRLGTLTDWEGCAQVFPSRFTRSY